MPPEMSRLPVMTHRWTRPRHTAAPRAAQPFVITQSSTWPFMFSYAQTHPPMFWALLASFPVRAWPSVSVKPCTTA